MTIPYDPTAVRVLLVAADQRIIKETGSLLRNDGFDIFFAHTLAQAAERCMEDQIDLVVCAADIGEGDPFALCEEMAERAETEPPRSDGAASGPSSPPFIFLVDRGDPQAMPRAFRAKAADCVSLPCQPEEFLARVRRELELLYARRRLASQRRELDDAWRKLEAFARLDSLTGIPDRRYAVRRVEEEISRAQRSGGRFCVVLAELPAGLERCVLESSLKALSSVLRAMLRDHDILCRWSERGLLLLLPDSDRAGAASFASRCLRILGEMWDSAEPGPMPVEPTIRLLPVDQALRGSGEAELRALLAESLQADPFHPGRMRESAQ